jgi:uncharacterized membrane protein
MRQNVRVIVGVALFGTCGVLGASVIAGAFPEATTEIGSVVGVLALALILILSVQ